MTEITTDQIVNDLLPWLHKKIQGGQELNSKTDLIKHNLLDSMEFLELVSFLEKKYNIELDPDSLTPDNFKTPNDIAKMVERALK
jgi:acyl carrier protein